MPVDYFLEVSMKSVGSISPGTRLCAVIGNPIEHSLSPAIHNAAFAELGLDFVYVAFRVEDAAAGVKDARAAQAAILKAVTLVPEMVGKMPDGPAKEKASAEFKQQMGELYVVFCKAELMFLAGETGEDKVDAMIDAFKASKKKAHDQFIEEDE